MAVRVVVLSWSHTLIGTVLLAEVLDLGEDAKATLWRNKTGHDLLGNIFGRRTKQVLQLDGTELLDDGALFTDALVEALLELVQFALLFIEVLDQSSSSFLHFVQTALESLDHARHWALNLSSILRVPHVVSDELFN